MRQHTNDLYLLIWTQWTKQQRFSQPTDFAFPVRPSILRNGRKYRSWGETKLWWEACGLISPFRGCLESTTGNWLYFVSQPEFHGLLIDLFSQSADAMYGSRNVYVFVLQNNYQKISASKHPLQNQDFKLCFFKISVSKYPLHSADASQAIKILSLILLSPRMRSCDLVPIS